MNFVHKTWYWMLVAFITLGLIASCGDSPTASQPDELISDFDVYYPNEDTEWHLWQTGMLVEYDFEAIPRSKYAMIELFRDDSLAIELTEWFFNEIGSETTSLQIPESCGMGDDFRIRVITLEEDTGYSAQFSIDGYYLSEFVEAPAGSFMMGSDTTEWAHQSDESPVHTVTFASSFEIMSVEVCQRLWENVMEENPSTFLGDSLPVEYVNWSECQEFIDNLNMVDPDYNYRLPTEAEWEYACRAGTDSWFFWGDDNSTGTVGLYGWYNPNSDASPQNIGSLEPNPWGLYDMSGNIYEWCEDVSHDNYTGAPTDGSAWVSGGNQGYRIQRGGSWSSQAQFLRSANRTSLSETQRSMSCGFRLIREPK